MADACPGTRSSDPALGNECRPRAAGWLGLAATPAFAIMALLNAAHDGNATQALCATAHGSALGGMAWMYLLMSVFHAGPWLRRIGSVRASAHPGR